MVHGGEVGVEDWVNGTGSDYAVQVSRAFGVVIWELGLVGDGGHAQIAKWVPPSGRNKDCGGDGAAYENRGVGMAPGGQSDGYR